MILAAQGDWPDGALDRVGVKLDAAIVEVEAESFPSDRGVADGVSERAARGTRCSSASRQVFSVSTRGWANSLRIMWRNSADLPRILSSMA